MKPIIYKYTLELTGTQTIELSQNAVILTVAEQRGNICLWAVVDDEAPKVKKEFRLYGTGQYCDNTTPQKYVGTIHTQSGFVWHIFEVVNNVGD